MSKRSRKPSFEKSIREHAKQSVTLEMPELEHLPLWLLTPDDDVPEGGGRYYAPDGSVIRVNPDDADDYREKTSLIFGGEYKDKNRFVSKTYYRAGVKIYVSTVYLGVNYAFDGVPQFWETMVFTGPTLSESFGTRYASRAAALDGHRSIVAAIREEQRNRRDAWKSVRR